LVPFNDVSKGIMVPVETFCHQFGIILSGRFHLFECYHIRPYAPEKGQEVTRIASGSVATGYGNGLSSAGFLTGVLGAGVLNAFPDVTLLPNSVRLG
jgi:hypothetical protein